MIRYEDYFPKIFEDKVPGSDKERDILGRDLSQYRSDKLKLSLIKGKFDLEHFANIHKYLFQDSSTHAGVVRNYNMSKGSSQFATPAQIKYLMEKELPQRIIELEKSANNKEKYIDAITDLHSTLDLAHPFREGNGRSTRSFMSQLSESHGYSLDFSKIGSQKKWVDACIRSAVNAKEDHKRDIFADVIEQIEAKQETNITEPTKNKYVDFNDDKEDSFIEDHLGLNENEDELSF